MGDLAGSSWVVDSDAGVGGWGSFMVGGWVIVRHMRNQRVVS